jgi:hypothetical protein
VQAYREIKDTLYGKMADNLNVKAEIRTFAELAQEAAKELK